MNNEADNVLKKVCLIKIAIDMHLRNYRVVRQIESSKPQSAQTVPRPQALRASVAGGSIWAQSYVADPVSESPFPGTSLSSMLSVVREN